MELIKPSEISGKIITLLDDAKKFAVIISPYYQTSNWGKLRKRIDNARAKGVQLHFFTRKPEKKEEYRNVQEIQALGYEPVLIERLHAKLYFNEQEAVITSMNLVESSDAYSLDIAVRKTSVEEYNQVIQFYTNWFKPQPEKKNEICRAEEFVGKLEQQLSKLLQKTVTITSTNGNLEINAQSKYWVTIQREYNSKALVITGILSSKEYSYVSHSPLQLQHKKLQIEAIEGTQNNYDTIQALLPHILSNSLDKLLAAEADQFLNVIVDFISALQKLKSQQRG